MLPSLGGCLGGGSQKEAPTQSEGPLDADFQYSPELPTVGEPIEFSDRSQGSPASWAWDFGDGSTSQEQNPVHAFESEGSYQVQLIVTDGSGATDSAAQTIQVRRVPTSPEAPDPGQFRIDFVYTVDRLTVEFEPVVTPSTAVVDAYYWEFGDGTSSRDSAPVHTYPAPGVYEVKLRASSEASLARASHIVPVGVAVKDPAALSQKSFAVVAIVDTGVNPYHEEFLDPAFSVPPSVYVDKYPADALALELSLGERSYNAAVKKDEATWKSVKANQLYWIPGTRIIGAISVVQDGSTKILDDNGHGTATASDAAGATIGSCRECLLVIVEGFGDTPLQWALAQPWIDVVSNSWGGCLGIEVCVVDTGLAPPPFFVSQAKAAVEAGKEVFFAAGNGMLNRFDAPTLTYWNAYSGPDWIVTVGAADSQTGATVVGTGRPFDVTSYGLDYKGAAHQSTNSIREFSGTSAATPVAAGAYAALVQRAREGLRDTHEGPLKGAVVAQGPSLQGMLGDGKLTRAEAERAFYLTARAATGSGPIVPASLPHSPAAFAYAGYGLVDGKTAAEAFAVVSGSKTVPSRPNEDTWAAADSRIRQAIWGGWNPGGDDLRPDPDAQSLDAYMAELGISWDHVAAARAELAG